MTGAVLSDHLNGSAMLTPLTPPPEDLPALMTTALP